MIYHDINGNEKYFDLSYKFGRGYCGDVYHLAPDMVLKIYRKSCPSYYRLNRYVYECINDINNPNIYKISDILYDVNDKKQKEIVAYTYPYVKHENINIFTTTTDYLLDNLNSLSNAFNDFSRCGIRVRDIRIANTIIKNDGIVLIDLDLLHKVSLIGGIDRLNQLNQLDLLKLFKEVLKDCAFQYKYNECDGFIESIDNLFNKSLKKDNGLLEIEKQLKKYKYPIDCIKEYKKNRF